MVWTPRVTVAAVVERAGRFLLVEEQTTDGIAFNQPAGHLEQGEDLLTAVQREVQEETGWSFTPEALVSVQLWQKVPDRPTFLRFCFTGSVYGHDPERPLDDGIIAAHWLTRAEIEARRSVLRSPLVSVCVDEYLKGSRYPLSMLQAFLDGSHA